MNIRNKVQYYVVCCIYIYVTKSEKKNKLKQHEEKVSFQVTEVVYIMPINASLVIDV